MVQSVSPNCPGQSSLLYRILTTPNYLKAVLGARPKVNMIVQYNASTRFGSSSLGRNRAHRANKISSNTIQDLASHDLCLWHNFLHESIGLGQSHSAPEGRNLLQTPRKQLVSCNLHAPNSSHLCLADTSVLLHEILRGAELIGWQYEM